MPVPIIELQRRLTLVGEIRIGGEKQPKRPGVKLEAFRLTSRTRKLVEQAGTLYGGDVTSWASPNGDAWQVYTQSAELPVLVMPSHSLTQRYELWEGASKRLRICDGYTEDVSGDACLCKAEGFDRCDIYTRLVVALPELDTVLGWRLITRGANAASELPTMLALIERVSNGATFVPAKLRLDQRRSVKDGQIVRFVVPTLDLGLSYLAFAARDDPRALPSAHQPPPETLGYEPTTEKTFALGIALDSVSEPLAREAREPSGQTAPVGRVTPPPSADAPAIPTPESEPISASVATLPRSEQTLLDEAKEQLGATIVETVGVEHASADVSASQTKMATGPQKKKLDVLVGRLRERELLKTPRLWGLIAQSRGIDPLRLVKQLNGREDPYNSESRIRWSPLRESLTRVEANRLIDWLEAKEAAERGEVAR